MAGYYLLLGLMRLMLVKYTRTHTPRQQMETEWKKYRLCGILLLLMTFVLTIFIAKRGDVLLVCKGSGYGKTVICDVDEAHIARQIMAIQKHTWQNMQYSPRYRLCPLNSTSTDNFAQGRTANPFPCFGNIKRDLIRN